MTAASDQAKAQAAFQETVSSTRWLILLGLITAAVMEVLDTTIVNVALPQMAGNLGATREEVAWVSTSYILANVVVLPMTAFFTEMLGRKRYLTISIVIFIVSSMLCGVSTSLGSLVLWRLVQGAGGAALLSTAQATLRQTFPREEQGIVQSIFLLGVIVAPTLGPTLGGWITDNASWHWCFFINLPIGMASAFLVVTFLHDPPYMQRHSGPIDWVGILLLIIGVGSLQYILEEGNIKDWFSSRLLVNLSIASAASLILLVWWQLSSRNTHPIIKFAVLKNRDLLASIFLFIVLGFGLYGGVIIFPLFTQSILGFSPTETGLAMMPGGIATAAMALLCGRLLSGKRPLVDPRVLIMIGMCLMLISMWTLGHLSTVAGESDARYALIIRGLALGLLFTPINNAAFGSLKPQEAQQASGLINLARQLGGSFGIAVLGAYLTRHIAYHRADLAQNMYPGNPAFQQRYDAIVGSLTAHGGSVVDAQSRALAMLDGTMMRQASMQAYNDAWMLLLGSFICVVPAVFLLRRPKARAEAQAAADAHYDRYDGYDRVDRYDGFQVGTGAGHLSVLTEANCDERLLVCARTTGRRWALALAEVVERLKGTAMNDRSPVRVRKIVERLGLSPHPERGFYVETYRATARVTTADSRQRSASTAIYFLVTAEQPATYLHRLASDEVFHLYEGGPLEILRLFADGTWDVARLGLDLEADERPQIVVPAGTWFATALASSAPYCLMGCTVAPGFDFTDFELAEGSELEERYPDAAMRIRRHKRSDR